MKFALITGGSSGIGAEYARNLAARGHNIIIVSNQAEAGKNLADRLAEQYGVVARALYADLAQPDSAQMLYDQCREWGAEVDVLISNAGVLHFGRALKAEPQYIDFITALHVTTPMKLCRLFGADMCSRGCGRILIMSSITAWTPYPTMSLYGSTKVALKSFGQSLWYELRGMGVSVTTVFPGAVDTPLYNLAEERRRLLRSLGLMMPPEEVVRKALRAMFRGRRRCVPGLFAKIAVCGCKILPARALLLVMRIPAVKRILESL